MLCGSVIALIRIFKKKLAMVLALPRMFIDGSKGVLGTSPPVQTLPFSHSFQQIFCQIINFGPKSRGWRPRLGITGSATDVGVSLRESVNAPLKALLSHLCPAHSSRHAHLQPSITDPPFRHSAAQTEQKYTRDQFRYIAKSLQ